MRKLLQGIAEFRRNRRSEYAQMFARLALTQSPDALFVACSDSRVVPNLFASTEPGDLFVIRNVGNLIPACPAGGPGSSADSEAAAVEFAVSVLGVRDIIVCGHSECGAMRALYAATPIPGAPSVGSWINHAHSALERLHAGLRLAENLAPHDHLSQLNVLVQIEHLRSYPVVARALAESKLTLHAWWFDISQADVFELDISRQRFTLLDEARVAQILGRSD